VLHETVPNHPKTVFIMPAYRQHHNKGKKEERQRIEVRGRQSRRGVVVEKRKLPPASAMRR